MSITSDLDHWYFVILHKYNTDFPPPQDPLSCSEYWTEKAQKAPL